MIADDVRAEVEALNGQTVAPGLASLAIGLAESFDNADAPTAQAAVAAQLQSALGKLRALAPVKAEGDSVDDIARQREKRRAEARERAAGQ